MKPSKIIILMNLSLLILLESFLFSPQFFYFSLLAINLILFLGIYLLFKKAHLGKGWINLWILPFLFLNSVISYVVLIPQSVWVNKFFIQILWLLVIGFNFYYFKNSYDFCFHPEKSNNLTRFSSNFGFLSWFFILSALYGLQLFMGLSYWFIVLFLVILTFLTAKQNFWINNLREKKDLFFIFLMAFIVAQLSWSIYFLPFDYNSLGLIMSLIFYILLTLVRFYLTDNWFKKNLKSLLLFSGAILLLIVLTVKWR